MPSARTDQTEIAASLADALADILRSERLELRTQILHAREHNSHVGEKIARELRDALRHLPEPPPNALGPEVQ
jgi:hypothetical protein